MGGRTKPSWIVYEGGPLHGQRHIVHPEPKPGPWRASTPSATAGMQTPQEYLVTAEVRRGEKDGGMKLAPAMVARFVRTLPDEPIPPPDPRYATVQPTPNLGRF